MADVMYQFSWELKKACRRTLRFLAGFLLLLFFFFLFYKLQKEAIVSFSRKLYELPEQVLGFLGLKAQPDFLRGSAWLAYLLQPFQIGAVVFAMYLGVFCMTGWEENRLSVFFLAKPFSRFQAWWKKQAAGLLALLVCNMVLVLAETAFVYWVSITVFRIRILEIFRDIAQMHLRLFLIQTLLFFLIGGASLLFSKKRQSANLIFYFTIFSFLLAVWQEILDFTGFIMKELLHRQPGAVIALLKKLCVLEKASVFSWLSTMEPQAFSVLLSALCLIGAALGNWLLFRYKDMREE